VHSLIYGASPIAQALVEQARFAFCNAGLWHLYGLTEASGGGTILPPEASETRQTPLLRKPYPGFELRIVDPTGQPVPIGEVGESVPPRCDRGEEGGPNTFQVVTAIDEALRLRRPTEGLHQSSRFLDWLLP
jgi:acyl-CoA synthetase (AMP-forming)/AMP-acid ligase II